MGETTAAVHSSKLTWALCVLSPVSSCPASASGATALTDRPSLAARRMPSRLSAAARASEASLGTGAPAVAAASLACRQEVQQRVLACIMCVCKCSAWTSAPCTRIHHISACLSCQLVHACRRVCSVLTAPALTFASSWRGSHSSRSHSSEAWSRPGCMDLSALSA
jgi:hypothetical protein